MRNNFAGEATCIWEDLSGILAIFDKHGIYHDILNSSIPIPEAPGDIDIFVSENDYENALMILEKEGLFVQATRSNYDNQLIALTPSGLILQVHLQSRMQYWDKAVLYYDEIREKLKKDPLLVEYMYFLVRCANEQISSDKIIFKRQYYDNTVAPLDRTSAENILLERGVPCTFQKSRSLQLRQRVLHTVLKITFKLRRRILGPNRKDFFVIFLGVDGAGKSTAIRRLTAAVEKQLQISLHYHGLRKSLVWKILQYIKIKHESKSSLVRVSKSALKSPSYKRIGKLGSLLSILYLIEYRIRIALINGLRSPYTKFHFCDRSYLDHLLYRPFPWNKKWFIPKNSFIVYLNGDPELINARKPELTINMILRQDKQYRSILCDLNYSSLNTTELTEEQVTMQLKQLIFLRLKEQMSDA